MSPFASTALLDLRFGPWPAVLTRLRLLITSVFKLIGRGLPWSFRNKPQALQRTEPSSSRRHKGVVDVPQFWHTGGLLPCPPVVAAGDDVAYVILVMGCALPPEFRRLEVGADATDARADSPDSDGPREPGKLPPLLSLLPGLLSREPNSGSVPKYCDDAEDALATASVVD